MRVRSCPKHADAMDALWVSAKDGGAEIELDRCSECGGLWFDAGELEMSAALHARPVEGESEYSCPVCKLPMGLGALPRGLFAHRCTQCRGTFLDRKTLRKLQDERLPRVPDKAPKAERSVGFVCAKCGQQFPFAQGNGTSLGLVCPGCVVNPQVEKIRHGPTSTYRVPGARRGGIDFDLVDLLDAVGSLFRR